MGHDAEDWENAYGPDLSATEIAGLELDTAAIADIDTCLVAEGRLAAQGDMYRMRFSEVRRPPER